MKPNDVISLETNPSSITANVRNLNNRLAKENKEFSITHVVPKDNGNLLLVGQKIELGSSNITSKALASNPNIANFNPTSPPIVQVTSTINFPTQTISHVNGAQSLYYGVGNLVECNAGLGLDSNHNVLFEPDNAHWRSEDVQAEILALRVHTNILPEDLDGSLPNSTNGVFVFRYMGYKNGISSMTQSQRETAEFCANGYYTGGQDSNGMYVDVLSNPLMTQLNQLGLGALYGRYYWTVGVQIPASAATKDYTFDIQVDYQTI